MFFLCLRAGMGIHLVFTWKSHFQFKTPFNIKIFYKFFNNRQRWNYGSVSTKVASASNSRTSGTFFNRKCTAGKLANNSISNQIALLNIFKSQFPGAFHIFSLSNSTRVIKMLMSAIKVIVIDERLKCDWKYILFIGRMGKAYVDWIIIETLTNFIKPCCKRSKLLDNFFLGFVLKMF